jgi:hypothetical protein
MHAHNAGDDRLGWSLSAALMICIGVCVALQGSLMMQCCPAATSHHTSYWIALGTSGPLHSSCLALVYDTTSSSRESHCYRCNIN